MDVCAIPFSFKFSLKKNRKDCSGPVNLTFTLNLLSQQSDARSLNSGCVIDVCVCRNGGHFICTRCVSCLPASVVRYRQLCPDGVTDCSLLAEDGIALLIKPGSATRLCWLMGLFFPHHNMAFNNLSFSLADDNHDLVVSTLFVGISRHNYYIFL